MKLIEFARKIQVEVRLRLNDFRKPQFVILKGIKVPVIDDAPRDLEEALYTGCYERFELKTIASQLAQNDVVMELGTGLGLISSFCANKIGNDRVFTYEANPGLEPIIRKTYKLNNLAPNLQICMLGGQPGEQIFYVSESIWDSSVIQHNQDFKPVTVPVKSFNEEVRKINPSFLVMDIEGGEYDLLKDADLHNIRKISIELHERIIGTEKTEFVKSKLRESGFRLNESFSYRGRELFWQR
jgi:FkbM family methyltransferase